METRYEVCPVILANFHLGRCLSCSCRILPVLALLFLCSFLDRTNVGNARLYGFEQDVGMSDHQYDIGLAVFYATYIVR
jgi:hypothetical protein